MDRGGLIILEGPDGAGKTTLAKAIIERAESLGQATHYAHLGKSEDAWKTDVGVLLEYIRLAFGENKLVVADRHFIGESIYGQVYRSGAQYPLAMRHIDRLLYRYGALRVVCAPPVQYVLETHNRLKGVREEMYNSNMEHVAQRYFDLWHGCESAKDYMANDYINQLTVDGGVSDRLGWYHYDVTTDGTDMAAYSDMLLSELADMTTFVSPFLDPTKPNHTGWPRRQAVLLVGDKISDQNGGGYPFMANHGSSLHLAKTLHALNADESRICIVNANEPDGLTRLRQVMPFCGRTIAMGKEAEKFMEKSKLSYQARVRHPQHARRFSYHDDSYVTELRAAFNGMAGVETC